MNTAHTAGVPLVTAICLALSMVAAVHDHTAAQPFGSAPGTQTRHAVRGMVLTVDAARKTIVVSHDSIPNVMPAMTMPFEVRRARDLEGLVPGAIVSFTLVISKASAHAESVRIVRYESVEQDPLTARRLRLLRNMTGGGVTPLAVGQTVPDFTLRDQAGAQVSLSQFRGKVVALNFIYTSCVLPQFCYRLANHFSVVQQRFPARMGRDLVLLTVTFDPARDTPERLAEYASQWRADGSVWRFLTGSVEDVGRVCRLFGVDAFPDEGLISHSTRTVIIDRRGALAASIEGNQHTAAQLGDLLGAVLSR
jgi:protein SCO1/2